MTKTNGAEESRSTAAQCVLALAALCRFLDVEPIRRDQLQYPRPQIDAAARALELLPEDARHELVEVLSLEYLKAYGHLKSGVDVSELREVKEFFLTRYRLFLEEPESRETKVIYCGDDSPLSFDR
jgi:hypothetical protein